VAKIYGAPARGPNPRGSMTQQTATQDWTVAGYDAASTAAGGAGLVARLIDRGPGPRASVVHWADVVGECAADWHRRVAEYLPKTAFPAEDSVRRTLDALASVHALASRLGASADAPDLPVNSYVNAMDRIGITLEELHDDLRSYLDPADFDEGGDDA
jgi:hypothetical protein